MFFTYICKITKKINIEIVLMDKQLDLLARLSEIDVELFEMQEELGELPAEVRYLEQLVREQLEKKTKTETLINEIVTFRSNAHVTLQEINDKEVHLSEQQSAVRNNKEYDAMTKEIASFKDQRDSIQNELRTSVMKEENLRNILAEQEEDYKNMMLDLVDKEKELKELFGDQNEDVSKLEKERASLVKQTETDILAAYERVRTFHHDAAVFLKRGSCSGCFRSVPPQVIVEIRKKLQIYMCEGCGRILLPEEQA
jgi:predicted  nucleic acid-binding Zn-ribbon protein